MIETSFLCTVCYYGINLKMPCIHPSAIWLILFRVTGEAGREAGYNMDRSSIHDKATTHKQTNALTFTLSCYFEFPIHLSCKSLVCCRKLDHLEETPQTIKCPNKMTIHTDLIHAVKHVFSLSGHCPCLYALSLNPKSFCQWTNVLRLYTALVVLHTTICNLYTIADINILILRLENTS